MKFTEVEVLIILSTIAILVVVMMMISVYILFLRKRSQFIIKQKEKEALFERELAAAQVEMKEQTLSYVGRELHDDLGQKLSVVRLMNNQLITKLNGNEKHNLLEINTILGECVQDIREMSKTFITEQIEHFGLIDSIERELNRIKKLKLIEIVFNFNKHDVDIKSKHALILFRIIQECINNTVKHSKAKQLKIDVFDYDEFSRISLKDNGIGFNFTGKEEGSGLKSMVNRTKLMGADFRINSKIDVGTEININYYKK